MRLYRLNIPFLILLIVALAMLFDFLNGFRDSASIVATIIASHALPRRQALSIAALAELTGPFIFGVAVATTWGSNVLAESRVELPIILAALVAAIIWSLFTWWLGLPSSSSHALVGGLVGAAVVEHGVSVIKLAGLGKVLLALAISPPLGLIVGYLTMKAVLFLARGATPRINLFFRQSQIITAVVLALAYGANDAQKTMGVISLALVTAGVLPAFYVPHWVIGLCAGSVALGTAVGSRRLIKTLGAKFFKVRPVHGFTTQVASAAVILGAAILGGPVSTTQVVGTAILGVGSAERVSKVRWGIAGQITVAWLTTIPCAALLAAGLVIFLHRWM
jgi:PiT family inorganic phosphate transporter